MNESLIKILEHAMQLFTKYGIRSVSMDDIARDLGMSKKTLYLHVENKADLIIKCVQCHIDEEQKMVEAIFTDDKNAIDEMVEIGNYVYRMLQMMNPRIIYDMKKYYRESWQLIEEHRSDYIFKTIIRNIEQGIKEDLYRTNLDVQLIAQFYIEKTKVFLDDTLFINTNYRPADVYIEFLKYHIYGIASEKGNQYLRDNLATIKNNQYVK